MTAGPNKNSDALPVIRSAWRGWYDVREAIESARNGDRPVAFVVSNDGIKP